MATSSRVSAFTAALKENGKEKKKKIMLPFTLLITESKSTWMWKIKYGWKHQILRSRRQDSTSYLQFNKFEKP